MYNIHLIISHSAQYFIEWADKSEVKLGGCCFLKNYEIVTTSCLLLDVGGDPYVFANYMMNSLESRRRIHSAGPRHFLFSSYALISFLQTKTQR